MLRETAKQVGVVGSAARHYVDGPLALALLKRSVPVDAALLVRCEDVDVAATQEIVVEPEAGLHVRPRL